MDPILRKYGPEDPVVTRSFGVAVFLHALGHPIEHVQSRDGSQYNAVYFFPASARRDLEKYYTARNEVNALTERSLSHSNAEKEPRANVEHSVR